MAIKLRDYQQNLVDQIRTAYAQRYKCPLVVASTGAGKTIIFSYVTSQAASRDTVVLIAAHRKEIIWQISMSLAKFGVEHQIIAPADKIRSIKVAQFKAFGRSFVNPMSTTMVGSVQTIVSRFPQIDAVIESQTKKLGKPSKMLVVIDESHHVVEDTQWGRVMERYPDAAGLLVTASPERLDGRGLGAGHGGYADVLIEGPPMSWLIENGFLSPYRVFTTHTPIDMAGVRTRMGDYLASDVLDRVDKPSITGDAIQHYKQLAGGTRAVVFCVSVEHSKHVADEFNQYGIPAAHIDGKIDDATRDKAIVDFADGKVMVLTQVNLVSEGFDLASIAQKDVTIDCLIDLAPTQSLVNAMQRWGRALRPAPGKVAILLDHSGNVLRHGLPDDERTWSLEGRKKKKRAANDNDDEADVKVSTCPKCYAIHRPEPACPVCAHVYEIKARKVEQKDGMLVELSTEALDVMRRAKRVLQGKAQTVPELMAQGMKRGQAEKIVEARAKKQALIDSILAGFERHQNETGETSYRAFGVTISDVRKMKPKELTGLLARVSPPANDDEPSGFKVTQVK